MIGQSVAGLIGIGGILLFQMKGEWNDWLGVLLGSAGIVAYHHFSQRFPFRVVRRNDGEFWLKGASPEFLDSLEEP